MLRDSCGYRKIYIAVGRRLPGGQLHEFAHSANFGYTDLRYGIDGLARKIKGQFNLDPYEKNVLFLFCGRKSDRIKCLLWEGDGFHLMYKRLEDGKFQWPKDEEEARRITQGQFEWLMRGHTVERSIREAKPKRLF